jgi:extracellular matrix protein 14
MHRWNPVLSYLLLVLVALTLTPWVSAVPSRGYGGPPQPPFQFPHHERTIKDKNDEGRGWYGRFYDAVVQRLSGLSGKKDGWRADKISPQSQTQIQSNFRSPLSPRVRYDEDIVLRFNITSVDEAEALAEATAVLFLDVWESNNEWVDIRLAKDIVRFAHFCIMVIR